MSHSPARHEAPRTDPAAALRRHADTRDLLQSLRLELHRGRGPAGGVPHAEAVRAEDEAGLWPGARGGRRWRSPSPCCPRPPAPGRGEAEQVPRRHLGQVSPGACLLRTKCQKNRLSLKLFAFSIHKLSMFLSLPTT